ncbi:MAG: pyrroloquinoline quinone-dependent dehydrogenase, partial [Planctomycetaceae bacterium]|nr:pyrroloquinoline quinone-dependent dehydrogenase [Planctomycetaceae bacterium]
GAAVDPASGVLYVPSVSLPWVLQAVKGADADLPLAYFGDYIGESIRAPEGPQGLPINKPPYGRVTAIDLNTGEHKWMRPMGEGPRRHPALRHLNLPPLGWPNRTFVVRTPSLLLAVQEGPSVQKGFSRSQTAAHFFRWNRDPSLVALDPLSGNRIAKIRLPGNATGAPITYRAQGNQYIAVPIGGCSLRAELIVLRLPNER